MSDEDTSMTETLEAEIADLTKQAEAEQARNAGEPTPAREETPPSKPEASPAAKPEAEAPEKPAAPASKDDPAHKPAADDEAERNRQAAAQRVKWTELERERDEWKRRAEEAARQPAPQQPTTPEPRFVIPPDQVFGHLARAMRGEFEQPGQNDTVRQTATRVILDEMTSADVAQVQRAALMGQYGEASAEIADLASKYLPAVQHRERQDVEVRERQASAQSQQYRDEIAAAKRDFAPFCDATTDEGQFLQQYEKAILGDGPQALPKDVQAHIRRHPSLLVRLAAQAHAVSKSASAAHQSEISKLRAENEAYRKRLALKDSPESPSAPESGDHKAGDDDLTELYRLAEEEQARNTGRGH